MTFQAPHGSALALSGALTLLVIACSARDHGTAPLPDAPSVTTPAPSSPVPAASLAPPSTGVAAYGEPVTLAPGVMRSVGDDGLTVTFEAVSADSRCPSDVTCIWAGEAVTRVRAAAPGMAAATLTLHSPGGTAPADAVYAERFVVRLTEVLPTPISTRTLEPQDYQAVVVVTKK